MKCQPCRFAYDYIMDIQTAAEDSEYVFSQLNFSSRLPTFHSSSKSSKKPLEDYYRSIPSDLIKKVYSKYYLDFVLFGFSPLSVRRILDAGTDEPSEYSLKSNINVAEFEQYKICNDLKETFDKWLKFYCPTTQRKNSDVKAEYLPTKVNFKNNPRKCWNLSPYLFQN